MNNNAHSDESILNDLIKEKKNLKTNLLDNITLNKVVNLYNNINNLDHNNFLILYFLYNIRYYGIFSYLITEKKETFNYLDSFSYQYLSDFFTGTRAILSEEEIENIIKYALTLSEINYLLNQTPIEEKTTPKEKLLAILSMFNKFNEKNIQDKYSKKSDEFRQIIKIALLSIPQIPASPEFSAFSDENKFLVTGEEKKEKCDNLITAFDDIKITLSLADRLLLLTTIIEGFLWNKPTNTLENNFKGKILYDFCKGNLYQFLIKNIDNIVIDNYLKAEVYYTIHSHSFYLNQFEFYFYGNFANNDENKLKKDITEVLIANLSDLILFAKSNITKKNIDNINQFPTLSNKYLSPSIIHGIISISLPKSIGIYEHLGKKLQPIKDSLFARDNVTITNLEDLENPWVLYQKPPKYSSIDINDFQNLDENEIACHKSEKKIIFKINNKIAPPQFMVLCFDNLQKLSFSDLIENLKDNLFYIKYIFMSFVEKLQLISHSIYLNKTAIPWYEKVFCNLYMIFDPIRHRTQYSIIYGTDKTPYRSWEQEYFKNLLTDKNNCIIHDFGACCGRFEKMLLEKAGIQDNIKYVYAVDLNEIYLGKIRNYFNKKPKLKDKIITKPLNFCDLSFNHLEQADLVCFMNTTFGYFDDNTNKAILIASYKLLKDNGKLIIDQFHPVNGIKHNGVHQWVYPEIKSKYKLIKTSNFDIVKENDNYGRYYGKYIYFDIKNNYEKLIRMHSYDIKLYIKKWFIETLSINENNIKVLTKDDGYTMLIEITKKIVESDPILANVNVGETENES
jgi:SAM-dependent methyltransferase